MAILPSKSLCCTRWLRALRRAIIIGMRLDTFHYQRMLRYRYNLWRVMGYGPAVGLLAAWFLENGCLNFYSYVINKPKSGVKKRLEGEDVED